MTLNDLKVGQSAVVTAVGGKGQLRLRLLDMGIIPRTKIKVIKVAPLGDPIEISLRDYQLSLRRETAKQIDVKFEEEVVE